MKKKTALIGFDGSIDCIAKPIREIFFDGTIDYFHTIKDYGDYISSKAKLSCSIQLDYIRRQRGGNALLLGESLTSFGVDVTIVGMMGENKIDSAFRTLPEDIRLITYADPEECLCLEFFDGKIMMVRRVPDISNPIRLVRQAIDQQLGESMETHGFSADLIAFLNWGEIPFMHTLWNEIIDQELVLCGRRKDLFAFFDTADISSHSSSQLEAMLQIVSRAGKLRYTVLSLNENEAKEIGLKVLGGKTNIVEIARCIVEAYHVDEITIHTLHESIGCTANEFMKCQTHYVEHPLISTGAGDNYNAGYCAGLLQNSPLIDKLSLANRTAHAYLTRD
jgi:hypothetical protein